MMKYLFIILSAFAMHTAVAQEFESQFRLALVASQIDGDNMGGFNKPAFTVAWNVGYTVNSHWNWYSGVQYIQKGSRQSSSTTASGTRQQLIRLNYVEMPLILQYTKFGKLTAELGLSAGYLFHTSLRDMYGSVVPKSFYDYRSVDVATLAGMQYAYSERYSLYIQHGWSINKIRLLPDQKNRYLILGVLVPLNRL